MGKQDKPVKPKLSESEIADFESTFVHKDAIPHLRAYALKLSAEGIKQRDIYLRFLSFYTRLMKEKREDEENILGDVMDMIVDEYPPFNLNLPK